MIEYRMEQVSAAAGEMGRLPHIEVLKKHLPEILQPDVKNAFDAALPTDISAAVFNMEFGSRLERIEPYLLHHPILHQCGVLFANELDCGMARSGNRNTVRELAEALSMNYAYGVEFVTVYAGQRGNGPGMGGNAILSRYPLFDVSVFQLPVEYEWFYKPGDPRLGMRNAVAARIRLAAGEIVVCSVHLENRATPAGRERQLAYLLAALDGKYGKRVPVLIGGDMNTNTVDGDDESSWNLFKNDLNAQLTRLSKIPEYEPLLQTAEKFGYDYRNCNLFAKSTRRKTSGDAGLILLNLDWFFSRGLHCDSAACIDTVFDHASLAGETAAYAAFDGLEMSDHNAIAVRARL